MKSLQRVLDHKIVAVIRAENGDLLVDVAESLLAGGVEVMEVTFTVPRATRVLEKVADRIGSRILLWAGTVLDTETCRTAILAGAEFIVSPAVNVDVIELCKRYSKPVMPGALTPTEVITAWQAGASPPGDWAERRRSVTKNAGSVSSRTSPRRCRRPRRSRS